MFETKDHSCPRFWNSEDEWFIEKSYLNERGRSGTVEIGRKGLDYAGPSLARK